MDGERLERTFIVRMWHLEGDRAVWRGSIRDVGAARTRYVAGPREVADYIEIALEQPPVPHQERTPEA